MPTFFLDWGYAGVVHSARTEFSGVFFFFVFCLQAIEPKRGETEAKGAEIAAS